MSQEVVLQSIVKSELLTLVGEDDDVGNSEYGASVYLPLSAVPRGGEIISVNLFSTGGDIQEVGGVLFILSADPETSAGDTALSAAERVTILGQVEVAAADWQSDTNGANWYASTAVPVPAGVNGVYLVWQMGSSSQMNSDAGDDEVLQVVVFLRRG